jgi:Na+/pantothenate symporter
LHNFRVTKIEIKQENKITKRNKINSLKVIFPKSFWTAIAIPLLGLPIRKIASKEKITSTVVIPPIASKNVLLSFFRKIS